MSGPAAPSTRLVYEGYLRCHILPSLGEVQIDKLTVDQLDRWYARLRDEKGLKASSIRKIHNIVRASLAQGVRWGWAPVNVAIRLPADRFPARGRNAQARRGQATDRRRLRRGGQLLCRLCASRPLILSITYERD